MRGHEAAPVPRPLPPDDSAAYSETVCLFCVSVRDLDHFWCACADGPRSSGSPRRLSESELYLIYGNDKSVCIGRITVSYNCFCISLRHIIYFSETQKGSSDRKCCGKQSTLEEKWRNLEIKCHLYFFKR